MGIGHFAVGLSLKQADRSLNAGVLVFAAFLSDFLLGIFVPLGLEDYQVPADFATRHILSFTFPYSHGLAACVFWAGCAGLLVLWLRRADLAGRAIAGLVVAAAVFSHFFLDALVHPPQLPILGEGSRHVGLGLWNHLPFELSLEAVMILAAVVLYYRNTRARSALGRYGMATYTALIAILMIGGQASGTAPPARNVLIASWLILVPVFAAIAFWLDREREAT